MAKPAETDELIDISMGKGEALRVEDVMRLLHLGRTTVYKMVREGELPSYRVGRQVRFRYDDIMTRVGGLPSERPSTASVPATTSVITPEVEPAQEEFSGPYPDVLDELPSWMRGSLVVGGEDMSADILANYLPGLGCKAVRSHANGYVSLARMYLGTVHAAAVSLWSGEEERYNLPFVRALLPGMPVIVMRLVRKRVGFTVRRKGSFAPAGWSDLLAPGVRIANRERGAEARVLLDEHMTYLEADPSGIAGYDKVVTSEFAQALLVARGMADVAVTSERPYRQMDGLDFIPLQDASCDLVIARTAQTAGLIRAARSLLRTEAFRSEFDASIYDTSTSGDVLYEL